MASSRPLTSDAERVGAQALTDPNVDVGRSDQSDQPDQSRVPLPVGGLPAIAPDGHTVALGQNSPSSGNQSSSVTLLDRRTGRHRTLLATLPDHWIRSLAFTPDGTELAGAATDGIHVWDPSTGKILESYGAGAGPRTLSTLDPLGMTVISGHQDGSIAAFDLSGARRLGRAFRWNTPDHALPYGPSGAQFSPDGHELFALGCCFTGSGSMLVAWDARTGRQLFTLGSALNAQSFDLAPDWRLLGVGTGDGRLRPFDPRTGREVRSPIQAGAGQISDLSFSPDGGASSSPPTTTPPASGTSGPQRDWEIRSVPTPGRSRPCCSSPTGDS
jgi:WD40 repeat protein